MLTPCETTPPDRGLAITVLGSGGPLLSPTRTSSGHLVWLDGRPRLLLDPGGGSFRRLGQLDVAVEDIDAVLLTHLHIDHSGDLAPVVFAMWMAERDRPLPVIGPAPSRDQPGCAEFCDLLFGPRGAWRYLHTFEGFALEVTETPSDPAAASVRTVLEVADLTVSSVAVPHGLMPSVAFRVQTTGAEPAAVCFSGDVESDHPGLTELARDVDLLVHDMALPERDVSHGHLHARPSQVGRQAAASRAGALLLTHVMPELEDERSQAESLVRDGYAGDVSWATDLATYAVTRTR